MKNLYMFLCLLMLTSTFYVQADPQSEPSTNNTDKNYSADIPGSDGWSFHIGPDFGSFHYYEGANINGQNASGQVTLSEIGYSMELKRDPGKKGIFGGIAFSQQSTGYGNENYLIQTNLPFGTLAEQNQQSTSFSNLYSDLYAGYQFPLDNSGKMTLGFYGFSGWRSMMIKANGGTYTATFCGFACFPAGSGSLVGTGSESDQSFVYGSGVKFKMPLAATWRISARLQVGVMPNVLISNNFVIPGTTQVLQTSGVDGFAQLSLEDRISQNLDFSVNYNGQFSGIKQSNTNSLGIVYPGGGWSDNAISVQLGYHF